MLILLSPAKSMDFDSDLRTGLPASQPRLLADAAALADLMRAKSVPELAELAGISEQLATLNFERWADFHLPFTTANARPAILAFTGDVYQGLGVNTRFGTRDFTEAQKTVRILSGLYGLLRPLDLIQPYRLEMGTRLVTERGRSLSEWWGGSITELLRTDLAESPGAPVVVNLASAEYSQVIRTAELDARLISPRFEDSDAGGRRKIISFYAKRARGELAAWLVLNRVRTAGAWKSFDAAGYRYDSAASTEETPVFVRAFADRNSGAS